MGLNEVRFQLQNYGVPNSDIGWNGKQVTIKGVPLNITGLSVNDSGFAVAKNTDIKSAYDSYVSSQKPAQTIVPTISSTTTSKPTTVAAPISIATPTPTVTPAQSASSVPASKVIQSLGINTTMPSSVGQVSNSFLAPTTPTVSTPKSVTTNTAPTIANAPTTTPISTPASSVIKSLGINTAMPSSVGQTQNSFVPLANTPTSQTTSQTTPSVVVDGKPQPQLFSVKNTSDGNIVVPNKEVFPNSAVDKKADGTYLVTGTNVSNNTANTQKNNSTFNAGDLRNYIVSSLDDFKKAQSIKVMNDLDNARTQALNAIQKQRTDVAPKYLGLRNQAVSDSTKQAKSFAEYMAQRGLSRSGANDRGIVDRGIALQNNMTNLNMAEQNALADLLTQENATNQKYNSDLVSANAGIDSDVLARELQAYTDFYKNATDEQKTAFDQLLRTNEYNRNISNDEFDQAYKTDSLGLDYQKQNQEQANKEREFKYQQYQDSLENAMAQNKIDNELKQYEKDFTESQRRWNLENSLDVKKQSLAERESQIQSAVDKGQLSVKQAELQLARDKFVTENTPGSLENQYKQVKDYISIGQSMLKERVPQYNPSTAQQISVPRYTTEDMQRWVIGLPVSDIQKINIGNMLGIPEV